MIYEMLIPVFIIFLFLYIYNFYLLKTYKYCIVNDYHYDFNHCQSTSYLVNLQNSIINIPLVKINHAIFVKITVHNNIISRWAPSEITISSNAPGLTKDSVTNTFEHAASGVRYLNISSLFTSLTEDRKDKILNIETRHIFIKPQDITVISIENRPLSDSKILILAPHPDDAEIASFGLYKKYNQAHIVTITGGDSGELKHTSTFKNNKKNFLNKGQIRTWNSLTVPLLADVPFSNILNLGFFDNTLKEMYENPTKIVASTHTHSADMNQFRKQNISELANKISGESNWESLVNNLEVIIQEIQPDIIITPHPEIDSHNDHKFTSIALFEALKNSKHQSGELFLYTNHHPLSKYYPYGQATHVMTLPPNIEPTKGFYFNSIYSQDTPIDAQKDKFIALEAMYDLRIETEWLSIIGSIKILSRAIKRKLIGDKTYFRRSIRSNELFFVVKIKNLTEIYKNAIRND
ncbi:MAG: PIG-L family deacetylase [Psychromonas sp.]